MRIAPENGLAPIGALAAKPSAPLRKSTGFVATITLTSPVGPITAAPSVIELEIDGVAMRVGRGADAGRWQL